MMFLGGTPAGQRPSHGARQPLDEPVYFDEEAMVQGVALYSALALRHLAAGPPASD